MKTNALPPVLAVAGVASAASGSDAFGRLRAAMGGEWIAQKTGRGRIVEETTRRQFTGAGNNAGR